MIEHQTLFHIWIQSVFSIHMPIWWIMNNNNNYRVKCLKEKKQLKTQQLNRWMEKHIHIFLDCAIISQLQYTSIVKLAHRNRHKFFSKFRKSPWRQGEASIGLNEKCRQIKMKTPDQWRLNVQLVSCFDHGIESINDFRRFHSLLLLRIETSRFHYFNFL